MLEAITLNPDLYAGQSLITKFGQSPARRLFEEISDTEMAKTDEIQKFEADCTQMQRADDAIEIDASTDQNIQTNSIYPEVHGFNLLRREFHKDFDYNPNLESYIADLEFEATDTQREIDLKEQTLELYN